VQRTLAFVCFVALAATGGAARADNREQARAEFVAGQDADAARDYLTAIHHYVQANELAPHPFALFNIAVDYERLGRLRDAATYYQHYVESTPDSADRAKVVTLLDDLKAKAGRVTVRSMPSGARVTIDGEPVAPTPYAGGLRGGRHAIAVELAGRRDHRDVTIEYGEPLDVQFDLGGASGTLAVEATPIGALITVDGSSIGLAPSTLELELGSHHVQISSFGYTTFEATVDIQSGHATQISAALVRADGGGGGVETPGGGPPDSLVFLAGGAGGVDVGGSGLIALGVVGLRAGAHELAAELGGGASGFAGATLYRYSFGRASVIPYLGIGATYAAQESGAFGIGGEVEAGLRFVLSRGARSQIEVRASTSARYNLDAAVGSPTSTISFPILLSLEAATR